MLGFGLYSEMSLHLKKNKKKAMSFNLTVSIASTQLIESIRIDIG